MDSHRRQWRRLGWIKSLNCKSRVVDDVVSNHHHRYRLLRASGSCKNGDRSVKDAVKSAQQRWPRKTKPPPPEDIGPVTADSGPDQTRSSARHSRTDSEPCFPTLTELPLGHPSRNVVEIIFRTSWSPKDFPGQIEMILKVQNPPRTVARFEEYREIVKIRDSCGGARCVADGNELMRFYCLGPAAGECESGGAWSLLSGKGTTICTFSGSGGAHGTDGESGRRGMMLCRVIAGRVGKQLGMDSVPEERVGFDSVSGDNGELFVFDSRAVLPCFLIIYKL